MSAISREQICSEIRRRIEATCREMEKASLDALIVYGDNKVRGSLRYLTDYYPDRAGWISFGPADTFLFEGAAAVVTRSGEVALLLEPGMVLGREVCTERVLAGGFSSTKDDGLTANNLVRVLTEVDALRRVGIETWDRFPAPLFLEMQRQLPKVEFVRSTVVERLRLVKSPLELELLRRGAEICDFVHAELVKLIRDRNGKISELELIRHAERLLRDHDPIYEDSCANSPSLISTGAPVAGALLHTPRGDRRLDSGEVAHWDICGQYLGYSIDSSRTKAIGKPSGEMLRAYETTVRMYEEALRWLKPGISTRELIRRVDEVARNDGYELWTGFLGHGTGLETHERPDLVWEDLELQANMTLAIEPRVQVDGRYVVGLENVVVVTADGGKSLNQFPYNSLEL